MKSDGRTDAVVSGVYTEKSHSEEKKKTAFFRVLLSTVRRMIGVYWSRH
jgi:hypothetical protein